MQKSTIELSEDASRIARPGRSSGTKSDIQSGGGPLFGGPGRDAVALAAGTETIFKCAPNWREFCTSYLKISGSEADRIIRLWEEFGASYFELAQLIRISPEGYRAIEPAVKDGALHHEGEAIEFDAENSRKLADGSDGNARRSSPQRSRPGKRRGSARCMSVSRTSTGVARSCSGNFNRSRVRSVAAKTGSCWTRVLMRARNELSEISNGKTVCSAHMKKGGPLAGPP